MTAESARGHLCIIPARGGSKRFPRKNLALLAGKPLTGIAVETAIESGCFETVCVSSEDEEVLQVARRFGADALPRPSELAGDQAQVKHVCAQAIEAYARTGRAFAAFAVLLPTSPLRTPDDIRAARDILMASGANCCMSLVAFSHPPQRAVRVHDGFVSPFLDQSQMKPAQQLEPLYRHDGTVLYARTDAFLVEGEFYGSRTVPYIVPADRSVDIDAPIDLTWAEFLLTGAPRPV